MERHFLCPKGAIVSNCTAPDCENPTDLYLCNTCVTDLQAWIDKAATVRADLFVTMAKLDKTAPKNVEGGSGLTTGSAMPLRDSAMEARTALAAWVGQNAALLAKERLSGDYVTFLPLLIRKAERLMDNPEEIHTFGKCGADDCTATLTGSPDTTWVNCPDCEAPHNIRRRLKEMKDAAKGQPLPPRQAREYLRDKAGISIKTKDFENWVQLRRLAYVLDRVTTDNKPRKIYFPGDVFRTYQEMKERRRIAG